LIGSTPLHLAAKNNSVDCATLLLEWGADSNTFDNDDRTPKEVAIQNSATDVATLLTPFTSKELLEKVIK
jgi:ankyrin repeat protein